MMTSPGFGLAGLDLGPVFPKTYFAAGVNPTGIPISSYMVPRTGYVNLLLGIDVYPEVQPNNGFCQVIGNCFPGSSAQAIYLIQQSANFPGPFHWRGIIPIPEGPINWSIDCDVGFNVTLWGAEVPDYRLD